MPAHPCAGPVQAFERHAAARIGKCPLPGTFLGRNRQIGGIRSPRCRLGLAPAYSMFGRRAGVNPSLPGWCREQTGLPRLELRPGLRDRRQSSFSSSIDFRPEKGLKVVGFVCSGSLLVPTPLRYSSYFWCS